MPGIDIRVDAMVPGIKYELLVLKRDQLTGHLITRIEGVTVEAGRSRDVGEARAKKSGRD